MKAKISILLKSRVFAISAICMTIGAMLIFTPLVPLGMLLFILAAPIMIVSATVTIVKGTQGGKITKLKKGGSTGLSATLIAIIMLMVSAGTSPALPKVTENNAQQAEVVSKAIESQASESKTNHEKDESQTASVTSSKLESKLESKSESKSESKVISQNESKTESKIESKAESKSANSNQTVSKLESKSESLSKEEYLKLVKEAISSAVGEGEKITSVRLDEETLYINVDINNVKLHSGITIADLAVSKASSITDEVLQLDTSFWNNVVVDFKNLGTISRKKSEIVHSEYGDYFVIYELDNISNSNSESSSKVESKQESKPESKIESKVQSVAPQSQLSAYEFYGNMDSMCYHTKNCHASQKISDEHRFTYTVNAYSLYDAEQAARQYFESQGYQLCGICAKQ